VAFYLSKAIQLVDRQIKFVEEQILHMQTAVSCPHQQKKRNVKWTGSLVDLVELGYALEAVDCINDGKITLTELFVVLSEVFDIDIKDFSRTFKDIKTRYDRTKFLDELKQAMLLKLKVEDEKPPRK